MPFPRCLINSQTLTREEHEAAMLLARGDGPLLQVDDAMFARIEARWSELPQRPGIGPHIRRYEDYVRAGTAVGINADVYRISPDAWGLYLEGTSDDGLHRGSLDELLERALAAWPPTPAWMFAPPTPEAARAAARSSAQYAEAAGLGALAEVWPRFRVIHLGEDDDGEGEGDFEPTPAQKRAVAVLRERSTDVRDALLQGLYGDYLGHDESLGRERVNGPRDVPEHTALKAIRVLRRERDGIAYASLDFEDSWRVEHGLAAILHGARVVAVGDHDRHREFDDDGEPETPAAIRGPDGAIVGERWIEAPGDNTVAFPFWEGLSGRFKVKFAFDEEDEAVRTDAQDAAAAHLVEHGAAVRAALLDALYRSYAKKTPEPRPIASPEALGAILEARSIRVDLEEHDELAYVALTVGAPWRDAGRATVVMHGSRVVAVTTSSKVEDTILDDQDAVIRARRAAKKAAEADAAARKRAPRKAPARRPVGKKSAKKATKKGR